MKTRLIILFSTLAVVAAFFVERVPQDANYHLFADSRTLLGVPNFWNVASNAVFLFSGSAGLWFLRVRPRAGAIDSLYPAYFVFFAGVVATGLGSGWYHLAPENSTLVWDRLAMIVVFMALFAIVIGEQVYDLGGRRLLIPLLIVGASSVFYWYYAESTGSGDLRPYALVQFLPMVLIPVILFAYESPFGSTSMFWLVIALYVVAKVFEQFDYPLFEATGLISGHTMKHLVAALVPLVVLQGMKKRRLTQAVN